MKVVLVGAHGNMGIRYRAILNHLGHVTIAVDLPWPEALPDWDHAIIATPTGHHYESLCQLSTRTAIDGKIRHVLMEKPFGKSLAVVDRIYAQAAASGFNLLCVNQYNYLPDVMSWSAEGPSWYDYYRHGDDGMLWDCFQIFALARGRVDLMETSPTWRCGLNGCPISNRWMDYAYVWMVEDFLGSKTRVWGRDIVTAATKKMLEWTP